MLVNPCFCALEKFFLPKGGLFYESFYSKETFYKIVKPEACIMLDIALSKGGPEAIAES